MFIFCFVNVVSQVRSQCKTILVNKALVLSVRRHHARVTHQIMLLVLSSAGARGAKGSNEMRKAVKGVLQYNTHLIDRSP